MTDKLRELALLVLESHGCERLKDFYECGPVQRAAVETFLEAALSQQDAQAVPGMGRKLYGELIAAIRNLIDAQDEPARWGCVGPTEADLAWDRVTQLANYICLGLDSPPTASTPPAQRVMLTDDEIDEVWNSIAGHSIYAEYQIEIASAMIEAYERKNRIK